MYLLISNKIDKTQTLRDLNARRELYSEKSADTSFEI